jgi:hypothetical protein
LAASATRRHRFDLVEEPLDQVTRSVQIWAEADLLFAISFRWDVFAPGNLEVMKE